MGFDPVSYAMGKAAGGGGTDVSDTTATAQDVLSGKDFYLANGTKTSGTIPLRSGSDISIDHASVSVLAGYYRLGEIVSVASGSATTPAATIPVTPNVSVNSDTGVITSSVSGSLSITPTVSEGYVSSGTAGTVSVSGTNTAQMTVQAARTITPTTSAQTIAKGTFLTGAQTIAGDANLVAGNIKNGVQIFGVTGSYTGGGGGGDHNVVYAEFDGQAPPPGVNPMFYDAVSGDPVDEQTIGAAEFGYIQPTLCAAFWLEAGTATFHGGNSRSMTFTQGNDGAEFNLSDYESMITDSGGTLDSDGNSAVMVLVIPAV